MAAEPTKETVRAIIARVLGVDARMLADDSSPDTIEGWDSVRGMNIVLALEEELRIRFSDEQIDSMLNVRLICLAVEEALARE